jgi:hypothetical protein
MSAWDAVDQAAINVITARTEAFEATGGFGDDDITSLFDDVDVEHGVATGLVPDVEFENAEDEDTGVSWLVISEVFQYGYRGAGTNSMSGAVAVAAIEVGLSLYKL